VEGHDKFRLAIRTAGLDTAGFGTFIALILFAGRTKATPGICLFALVLSKYTLQLHGYNPLQLVLFWNVPALHGNESVKSKTHSIAEVGKAAENGGKTRVLKS
jgi:hypothetical protein